MSSEDEISSEERDGKTKARANTFFLQSLADLGSFTTPTKAPGTQQATKLMSNGADGRDNSTKIQQAPKKRKPTGTQRGHKVVSKGSKKGKQAARSTGTPRGERVRHAREPNTEQNEGAQEHKTEGDDNIGGEPPMNDELATKYMQMLKIIPGFTDQNPQPRSEKLKTLLITGLDRCSSRILSERGDPHSPMNQLYLIAFVKVAFNPGSKMNPQRRGKRIDNYIAHFRENPEEWFLPLVEKCMADRALREQVTRRSDNYIQQGRKAAEGFIRKGQYRKATSRLFNDNGRPRPFEAQQFQQLQTEISGRPPPEQYGRVRGHRPRKFAEEEVKEFLKNHPTGQAPGISGFRDNLLPLLAVNSDSFVRWFTMLVNKSALGQVQGELLRTARVTAIPEPKDGKPDNVRFVYIFEQMGRSVSKFLLLTLRKQGDLHDFQFGVDTPGGVEPVLHGFSMAIFDDDMPLTDTAMFVVKTDMKKAYQSILRTAIFKGLEKRNPQLLAYAIQQLQNPTKVVVEMADGVVTTVEITNGVITGDPIAGYFFSIGICDAFDELKQRNHTEINGKSGEATTIHSGAMYLDDNAAITKHPEQYMMMAQEIHDKRETGIQFHPAGTPNKNQAVKVSDLRSGSASLELLGSVIGRPSQTQTFIHAKVEKHNKELEKLKTLRSQDGWLLLRYCVAPKLLHLLRTINMSDDLLKPIMQQVDRSHVNWVEEAMKQTTTHDATELTKTIVTLPVDKGGMGLPNYEATSQVAFKTSEELALRVLAVDDTGLEDDPPSQRDAMELVHNKRRQEFLQMLSPEQVVQFVDNASKTMQQILSVRPYCPATTLTDREIALFVRAKCLDPQQTPLSHCPECARMNTYDHDQICQEKTRNRTARHEAVKKKVLFNAVKSSQHGARTSYEMEIVLPQRHHREPEIKIDVRIVGEAAMNGIGMDTDISFTTVSTGRNKARATSAASNDKAQLYAVDKMKFGEEMIKEFLEARAVKKRSKYSERAGYPFVPLIISAGGWLHHQFYDFAVHLKGKKFLRSFYQELAVGILRARTINMQLY